MACLVLKLLCWCAPAQALPCLDSSTECLETLTQQAIGQSSEIEAINQQLALTAQRQDYAEARQWTNYLTLDPVRIVRNALGGIDAPETGKPMGIAARDHLRALVAKGEGGQIIVVPIEKDRYGRTVADLFVALPNTEEEIHLNSQMVMDGYAYHYERYSSSCPQPHIFSNV